MNDRSHVYADTLGTTEIRNGHASVPVTGGPSVYQPLVSQPSAAPVRASRRAHRVSSRGGSTRGRSAGWPLASRLRWKGDPVAHARWVSLIWAHAPVHQP